jgi:hypothetical protein
VAPAQRRVPAGVRGNLITSAGFYEGHAPPADGTFYFHDLGHRCVDFGGRDFWRLGGPVVIFSCNGTIAQHVRLKEIDASHDVEFRVQFAVDRESLGRRAR